MKTILITAIVLLVLYVFYKTYSTSHIDNNLPQLINKDVIILDVRTKREFAGGHIKGAVNIPLSSLRTIAFPFDTSKTIITCCSHGLRSIKAVEILQARGFKHAHNGGAWTDLHQYIKR